MIQLNNDPETGGSATSRLMLFISAICTLSLLSWVVSCCRRGIDLADEGWYIVWMDNPAKYAVTVRLFGFFYRPLYLLLRGNIALVRQVNLLLTFGIAWVLVGCFLKSAFCGWSQLERTSRLIISGAISTASLFFLAVWIPTPSYNWLAFQALLMTATGLVLAQREPTRQSILGWLLVGIGSWMAFMGKPTTAAALLPCIVLYSFWSKKPNKRLLALSAIMTLALLILTALTIDGSVAKFIARILGGLRLEQLLGDHSLRRILRLECPDLGTNEIAISATLSALILLALYCTRFKSTGLQNIGNALCSLFAMASLSIAFRIYTRPPSPDELCILPWSIPCAIILTGFATYRLAGLLQITPAQWALAAALLSFPFLFAFGSANNYWQMGSLAAIFYVLAGIVFLIPITNFKQLLLSLGFAVQMLVAVEILIGVETPFFYQPSLRLSDYAMRIGKHEAPLRVPQGFGRYIESAVSLANNAKFVPGTPMIDMTGHSPGLLYAIGASNTGLAWLIGNAPGRLGDKYAAGALNDISCEELSRSWLLLEPEGPIKISSRVLSVFGANLATDYEVVGQLKTVPDPKVWPGMQPQEILRPTRLHSAAMDACLAARADSRLLEHLLSDLQ